VIGVDVGEEEKLGVRGWCPRFGQVGGVGKEPWWIWGRWGAGKAVDADEGELEDMAILGVEVSTVCRTARTMEKKRRRRRIDEVDGRGKPRVTGSCRLDRLTEGQKTHCISPP